jgi:hypothetical protein
MKLIGSNDTEVMSYSKEYNNVGLVFTAGIHT